MSKIRKTILFAAVLVISAWPWTVIAIDHNQQLQQARAVFDQGQFEQAVEHYQELLDQGYDSGELYYNLGNAAFKTGQIGEAIAYYRRAAKRLPWDEDIEFNLNFARKLVKQPQKKINPIDIVIQKLFMRFSAKQLSFLALLFYFMLMTTIGILILKHHHHAEWNWGAAAIGLLFIFFAILASARVIVEKNVKWGVVVVEQAEARNGPGADYQVGFTVPEGREVRVLGHEGDWLAIGLTKEGYKGWVKSSEIWKD